MPSYFPSTILLALLTFTLCIVTVGCDDAPPPPAPSHTAAHGEHTDDRARDEPARFQPAEPAPDPQLVRDGIDAFDAYGCGACHTVEPTDDPYAFTGPPLAGIYGKRVELDDGRWVEVDEDYLYRSIREPQAERVRGYYGEMLIEEPSEEATEALVAYIKTLKAEVSE